MSIGSGTFKSYVSQAEEDFARNKKLSEAYEKVYERPDDEVNKRLLPGELAIGHAKKVIKYIAHDDPSRGISGTLICTNFRVSFITKETPTYDLIELQNHLLGEQDIPLNSIDSIYVEYSNKRKKLVPGSKVKDGIKRLEIHCKDFRVAAFNFKLTVKFEEKGVIKAILHHAYPAVVSLLFAFDHQHSYNVDQVCKVPLFRSYRDWQELIKKHKLSGTWRVSSVNLNFTISETMGEHFIVPNKVTDNQLINAANQFCNNRLPSWCWTTPSGCSLVRCAELRQETEFGEVEKELHAEVQRSDPSWRQLRIIDVGKLCPTCQQIQQSFLKLKNLCMPASEEEYWQNDSSWFSLLQATKWLQHVGTILSVSYEAVDWLINKEHNVIIREASGVDISPVVSSLIQLIADPVCRTLDGFQSLIQREWVVGGFPFLDRLGHLIQPIKSKQPSVIASESEAAQHASPIFLLFLDCVWQLLRQYPSMFQFSSTFLTVLYDGTRMSLFDTFIFNNERHRHRSLHVSQLYQENNTWEPLPIWAWSAQYSENGMKLFNNPLYRLHSSSFHDIYESCIASEPTGHARSFSIPLSLSLSTDMLNTYTNNTTLPSPLCPSPKDGASPTATFEMPSNDLVTSDDLQLHYNSKTGVMVMLGSETPDGDRKKKNRFSFRRKKTGKESDDLESAAPDLVLPADFYFTTMPELTRHKRAKLQGEDILCPHYGLANIHLWNSCHFRWNIRCQLFGGGPSAVYQQESMLYDEIHALLAKVLQLQNEIENVQINGFDDVESDESGMYFCYSPTSNHDNSDGMPEAPPDTPSLISNFFPYSPIRDMGRKSILGSPLSNFLRGGSLFNFTSRRIKHSRTSSELSITTPSGDEGSSVAATGGAVSSNSLNNLTATDQKKTPPSKSPKKALMPPNKPLAPPKKALMPPKDRITYISSV